jgi:hypothetical protein
MSTRIATATTIILSLGAMLTAATLATAVEPKDWRHQWYDQGAEITRYSVVQNRYGEDRRGEAVLIYVTEPLDENTGIKADNPDRPGAIPGLKLNRTRSFLTGVYPYSIMTSVFQPIDREAPGPALKVSHSMQEWCGQVFMQLNRSEAGVRLVQRSYFETSGDVDALLDDHPTEDGLWTRLRLGPELLPTGETMLIPGLTASRMAHRPLKPEAVQLSLNYDGGIGTYTIAYTEIDRSLAITFEREFPWRVTGWTEKDRNHGSTAKATDRKMLFYWDQNSDRDRRIRRGLGLPSDRL